MLKRLQIILQPFIMALFVIFVAFSNESKNRHLGFYEY